MNSEGIGLGLTMVKQIVETSGGSVGVYSGGTNKGSVFSFTMKMSEAGSVKASNPSKEESKHEETSFGEINAYPKVPIVYVHDDGFITFRDQEEII